MTVLQPYHQRRLITFPHVTEFRAATSSPAMQRWFPLFKLLQLEWISDWQVGLLVELKEQYESGFGRRG
jgi:hypothetical protein